MTAHLSCFMAAGPIERSGNDFAQFLCFGFFPFSLPPPFSFYIFFYFRHYPGHRIQFLRDKLWGEELRCGNNQFE